MLLYQYLAYVLFKFMHIVLACVRITIIHLFLIHIRLEILEKEPAATVCYRQYRNCNETKGIN